MRRMSAKEARDNFGDLLGSVREGREPVVVEEGAVPSPW
jgi:antitoxin (DNA-binding transcriptional repressor) of toxin-antitoxin stability system